MRSSFLTSEDIPVGYHKPPFPSLYWPISSKKYHVSYLYDTKTIWEFTVYWSVILNGGFYLISGLMASYTHRKRAGGLWIMVIYLFIGCAQGVVFGTVTGYLVSQIYISGLFAMSTWIPLCCAITQVLFDLCSSFSLGGMVM
ncbi:hypothetical protein Kpol_480p9 [Vanderwaltozyma polyspora DSM 70294]|uniref:Uncharacterized protein n=1 Tax=Vanderwaltozyma polyspora (strain ATCC 22028 / DSM 70294 / BCRC 21397 / CBS 2163 / NBRC 10782 / NRRL Y-8283 / UCD 57-17) TaxID=436907 RepID=A7TP71_VANPO|nr:uncharacterized protein Kpol_480p9 [Vanderwaltozyma polyspora DSM 70294]EDO15922.1 hypothetical protein Kpol_480p9 [Vanderwaltozyma polyspora DSM 70294]